MHVNIKRLLSFLVVLAMVLSMTPVTGIPAIEAKAETVATATAGTLTLDGESKAMCEACGESVVWTPLANGDVIGKKEAAGKSHYYLSEDSTVSTVFLTYSAGAEVCLHLNGKNLTCKGTYNSIVVQSTGKLNILGDGTVKRISNGALFEVWSCTLNLYGGTYILNTSAYGITDAAASKVMWLEGGSPKVTLYNNASLVGSTDFDAGVWTFAEGWNGQIGNLLVADTLWSENAIKKANAVVNGSLTGTVVCDQSKMVLTDGLLTKGETKLTANEYCQTCGKYVTWTELKNGQKPDGTSDHYYLAEDISSTDSMFIDGADYKQASAFHTVCLRLNGRTLTTNSTSTTFGAIYGSNATTINIYGEGGTVVNTGAAPLLTTDTSRVNLYGGTYISSAANATNIRGSASNLYLYNDAKIEGTATVASGKVYLNDSATIKGLNHTGGTVTAAAGWNGYLKNTDGKYIEMVDGAWTVVTKTPEWGKFEPEACDGKAYCEHCGKDAGPMEWTAKKGRARLGAVDSELAANTHYHFYLSGDLDSSAYTQVLSMSKGISVCLNLNGYDMLNAGRFFATDKGSLAIMGDGNVTMTASRTSDTESFREATVAASTTGGVYLYGGTYSVTGNAVTEGRPTIKASNKVFIKNATVNGHIDVSNNAADVKLEEGAVAEDIRITAGKVTVAAGWSGTANLTVPASALANGVLAAATGAAEGDFTGTLTCNGVQLVYKNGALAVEVQEPVWGEFNPEACGGYAYCEVCGEAAGPVLWTAKEGRNRIDYKQDGGSHHYYLTGDLNEPITTGQVAGVDLNTTMCVNLNGYNITAPGQVYIVNGTISFFGDGNFTFTGDTTATHPAQGDIYRRAGFYLVTVSSVVNLFGGTYSVAGQAEEDGKPMVLGGGTLNIKNATVNGCIKNSKVKLEGTAVAEDINLVDGGKVTVAAGWSGTANLTVADSALADGVLAAATGAAEGEFTGTLTCNGVQLSYQDGTLMADTTFDPEAETNYCAVCEKFVAWTPISGDNKIGVVQTGAEAGTDKHEHWFLSGDVNYTGTDPFVKVTRASDANATGSSVCLNLNGYNLTTKGKIEVGSGCDLAIFGEGSKITYTGTSTWVWGTCSLRLFGGEYTNVIAQTDGGDPKLYLSDGVSVSGTLNMPSGKLWLNDTASIGKVTLQTHGSYTTRKVILNAGWTGTLTLDATAFMVDGKVPAANAEVAGELKGTIKDPNGNEFTYAEGQIGIDMTFNPEAPSYCKACGTKVTWEALPETVPTIGTDGAHLHYYVPADMTATGEENSFLYIADSNGEASNVAPKVCLYLNNKTLTLTQNMYAGFSGVVNVIGDGTLTTTTASTLIIPYTSTVNLYGGTYIAKKGGKALSMGGSGAKVNLYEDAELQGITEISKGALTVYDQAVLTNLNITGGKTTFKAGWSGTAAVTAAESLMTDSRVNVANAYVEDGITGKLTDFFGADITVTEHALVMPAGINPDVFEPWNHNGYAYCDCVVCGDAKPVQWIDYNAYVAKNGFHDGDDVLTDSSGVYTFHFYLSADLNYTTSVMQTYENVIFNLNGYDINPVAKDGETAITAGYAFSSTQKLVLMNTAEEMSTVTGWGSASGAASVVYMGGADASSNAYLYDNVTLKTHKDNTADIVVVRIGTNGGTFVMNGGVIDASEKVNTNYPTAVLIEGHPVTETNKTAALGKFYMNGGEIKGGTSGNAAGAIRVGSVSTSATFVDGSYFYMNGGKISGGKAASGGNIYANKNAKEVVINDGIITGGEATVSGGNIYCHTANLTIGEQATISDGFIPFTNMSTFGIGGGNIYFANGTLTTSGVITGGTIEKFRGAGGNVFLDGNGGDISFIMNGGLISNGKLPTGEEEIYGGADFDGQSYGANIRGYKVKEIKLLGGTIEGGIGGNDSRVEGRDVYLACHDSVVTEMTIGDVTINGAILLAKHKLTLTGAPKINSVDGENALTVGPTVEMNISGLTEGADVELSNIVANIPLTVACDNAEDLKAYFTVIGMDGAVLNVVEGQLMVNGVAIIDGEESTWYATAADAIKAYTDDAGSYAAGKYIQLGLDAAIELTGAEYLIDLAGHVAGEVAITGNGTVHLFDSANLDFDGFRTVTVADTITLVRDNNVVLDEDAFRFITITDAEGKTSAHALAMAVNGVSLRTDAAGLYYSANYNCDEVLAELVSAYGVILSLNDMPGAVMTSGDQRTELTDFAPGSYATSSSVFGIFKDTRTAAKNAQYGKMKIYANAYIQLDLDADGVADVLVADTENAGKKAGNAWSLYDVLATIDQNWDDFEADQDAVKAFYDQWYDLGMGEYADDFTNIDVKVDVEGGEGEGTTPEDTDVDVSV